MKKFIIEMAITLLQFKLNYFEAEYHNTYKDIQQLQKELEEEKILEEL